MRAKTSPALFLLVYPSPGKQRLRSQSASQRCLCHNIALYWSPTLPVLVWHLSSSLSLPRQLSYSSSKSRDSNLIARKEEPRTSSSEETKARFEDDETASVSWTQSWPVFFPTISHHLPVFWPLLGPVGCQVRVLFLVKLSIICCWLSVLEYPSN